MFTARNGINKKRQKFSKYVERDKKSSDCGITVYEMKGLERSET